MAHLGIDEHRRGRPRWRRDEETGEYVQLADRWHTCFFDLSGQAGHAWARLRAGPPMTPRTGWPSAAPAWRDAVRVVAIDMCTIYASAVRRMLPGARDRGGPVPRGAAGRQDRPATCAAARSGSKYGRRGRSGDPEYGIKNLLVRNLEHLTPAQFAKIIETLDADEAGQQIAAGLDRQGETARTR